MVFEAFLWFRPSLTPTLKHLTVSRRYHTAIATAVFGLFSIFFRQDFCYDYVTTNTSNLLFIFSCNFNRIACVTSFSLFLERVLLIRVMMFLVTRDLLSKLTSSL